MTLIAKLGGCFFNSTFFQMLRAMRHLLGLSQVLRSSYLKPSASSYWMLHLNLWTVVADEYTKNIDDKLKKCMW